MTARESTAERIWQVRLPDGSVWIPADARPDDPRASWIYARSTADTFADQIGGSVVEVSRDQRGKVLDREIESALASQAPQPERPKTRSRPFSRVARRAIATAILENVPLNHAARVAVDTAREADDDVTHEKALRALRAGLPAVLWIGYDAKRRQAFAQEAEPTWIAEDPQGEDPGDWQQIDRDAIASILAEAS